MGIIHLFIKKNQTLNPKLIFLSKKMDQPKDRQGKKNKTKKGDPLLLQHPSS